MEAQTQSAKMGRKATISAVIIRANGRREDLGVIADSEKVTVNEEGLQQFLEQNNIKLKTKN